MMRQLFVAIFAASLLLGLVQGVVRRLKQW